MSWTDLEALCGDDRKPAIWDLLRDPEGLLRLSADGRERAASIIAQLTKAYATRELETLSRWVERTWLDLDGPACLDDDAERAAAEQFFALLSTAERGCDLDDPMMLERALKTVQPQADAPRENGIEIMTMHRAKGLEYDTVV